LVEKTIDGKYYPSLASSWEISEDAMIWMFKLKEGIKFHDGSEFNADVVKWFIEEMRKSPSDYMVQSIKSLIVEDPYTVTFRMEYPDPNLLFNLSSTYMTIPRKEAIEKYGEDFGIKYAVGTGAFNLDKAKGIMAEARWKDTDGDGILEKNGNKFIANLWVENTSVFRRVAEVAQEQLRKLGIDAKITQYDSVTFKDKLKKASRNY
jgi:ABC-type transport system substrate-binding protein